MIIIPRSASWVAYALLLVFLTAVTVAIMLWKPDYLQEKGLRLLQMFRSQFDRLS